MIDNVDLPKFNQLTPEQFNSIYQVATIKIYKSGMVLERVGTSALCHHHSPRKAISKMSKRSLSNLIFTAANTQVKFSSFITLTYGKEYPLNGILVKQHLGNWLRQGKRYWGNFDYLWVLEFQKRGAPHVHIMTTLAGIEECPFAFRETSAMIWANIVLGKGHRMYCDFESHELKDLWSQMYEVHRHPSSFKELWSVDGALRYILKYATKLYQKNVPTEYRNVGRFWGASYGVSRSVKPLFAIPISNDGQVKNLMENMGRFDLVDMEIIPKKVLIFDRDK